MENELSIQIGGEAGQGIQSIGQVLARSFVRSGLHVFAQQEYESRIRGGHAFTRLRVAGHRLDSHAPHCDILIALNEETVRLHQDELSAGGVVLYDRAKVKNLPEAPGWLGLDLAAVCREAGGSAAMSGSVAVGAVWALLGLETSVVEGVLETIFGGRGRELVERNVAVLRAGCALGQAQHRPLGFALPADPGQRIFISGNDAVALGALAAGVRFYSAYPMTPATGVMEYLIHHGHSRGVVVEQAEDEIAAINMALGASYMGARSMTGSSGGGFALMSEALGLAGCAEIPLVVLDAQRPGPATGMPTRTEQGDLLFSLFASHGEFPRVVLAPATPESAFRLTAEAFDLAERLQSVVILLTDHHLMDSHWTVEGLPLDQVHPDRGALATAAELEAPGGYLRYRITPDGVSPRAFPGQSAALVCSTGDEHDESGHITEEAALRTAMVDKRWRKLEQLAPGSGLEADLQRGAETVLVGWGSTWGALREAVDRRRAQGERVSLVRLDCLWPFPEEQFRRAVEGHSRLVVVENNSLGQLARLIRMETGLQARSQVLRYDGRPFCGQDILDQL